MEVFTPKAGQLSQPYLSCHSGGWDARVECLECGTTLADFGEVV